MKKIVLILAALAIGTAVFAAKPSKGLEINLKFNKENAEGSKTPLWPFTTPIAKSISFMAKAPSLVGEETVFSYKGKDGEMLDFKGFGVRGILRNSAAGFMLLGGPDSYLEFPVIPGKALKEVIIIAGQKHAATGTVDIRDKEGNSVSEQGAQGGFEAYDELSWEIQNAEAGKAYRITNLKNCNICIVEITLKYE